MSLADEVQETVIRVAETFQHTLERAINDADFRESEGIPPLRNAFHLAPGPVQGWDGSGQLWIWAVRGGYDDRERGEVILTLRPDSAISDQTHEGSEVIISVRAWDRSDPDASWSGGLWSERVVEHPQLKELHALVEQRLKLAWGHMQRTAGNLYHYAEEQRELRRMIEANEHSPDDFRVAIEKLGM